ncbi:S-adenosyl-L-methionine-dependent methyltransferase, partial [Neoconidiobolus thromboides FSU 785]
QTDKTKTYDSIANDYDSKTKWDEFVMGLYLLRRYVIKTNASGNVLELSVGTGRNMKYYHDTIGLKNEISSLTLLDKSGSMLQQSENNPYTKSLVKEYIKLGKRIRFYRGDSEHLKEFKENEFDTVIDTFGLCSYKDPIKAIKEMKRVCNKDGGKIILLQHGVGKLEFLNKLLNQHAEDHANKWGCWWNRDILKLCEAAKLDVQSVSRFHFGTTYYIVAKP